MFGCVVCAVVESSGFTRNFFEWCVYVCVWGGGGGGGGGGGRWGEANSRGKLREGGGGGRSKLESAASFLWLFVDAVFRGFVSEKQVKQKLAHVFGESLDLLSDF